MTPRRKLAILSLVGAGMLLLAGAWSFEGLLLMDFGAHGASRSIHTVLRQHAQSEGLPSADAVATDPNALLPLTIELTNTAKADCRHVRAQLIPFTIAGASLILGSAVVVLRTPSIP